MTLSEYFWMSVETYGYIMALFGIFGVSAVLLTAGIKS